MTEICPHLTGEQKTWVAIAAIISLTIIASVGGLIGCEIHEKRAFTKSGYCQVMVVGYTSPVWVKCP